MTLKSCSWLISLYIIKEKLNRYLLYRLPSLYFLSYGVIQFLGCGIDPIDLYQKQAILKIECSIHN